MSNVKKTTTTVVDDFTGSVIEGAPKHIVLTVDGKRAVFDLQSENYDRFFGKIAGKLTENELWITGMRSRSSSYLDDVRQWAREQGIPVAERGRVARETLDAYYMAHEVEVAE